MRNTVFSRLIGLSLLFWLGFYACCSPCMAYEMTEAEMQALDKVFNKLEKNNKQSKEELKTQKQALQEANKALKQVSTELSMQQQLLTNLKCTNEQQRNSLEQVEASFKQYEAENKAKIKSLKTQRTILSILTLAVIGVVIGN